MAKRTSRSDEIVDGIYAAVLEAPGIVELQHLLGQTLDTPASTMMRIDGGLTPMSWIGFDPGSIESYGDHYYRTDLWIAAGMSIPLGTALNVERLVPRSRYLESEFYQDFMRQHGDATQLLGLMFAGDAARYSLTFLRVKGQRDFGEDDEARFAHWAPHLARAFTTRERIDRQAHGIGGLAALHMDADVAHVLVDADMVVRWMSRAELSATSGVIVRQRPAAPLRLEALAAHTQAALLRAVRDATVRHPALSGAAPIGDDFILVDPCPWAAGSVPLALLHIPDRTAVEARAIERATGLFHLTAAEAALCRRLMRGDTMEMHAAAMHLSPWTVRTHLRNVFAKTGTSRQAELVALLHRLTR